MKRPLWKILLSSFLKNVKTCLFSVEAFYISTPGGQSQDFFDIVILTQKHRFEGAWFWLKHFLVVFRRRSLGFIAASRVSYGPLTEYKATRAKNYNKNKQKMNFSICCKFANIWCNLKFSRWCAVASLCSNLKLCNCCRLLSAAGTNSQISTNIGFQSHLDQT